MSDSFYHIKLSELNYHSIKLKNRGPKHTHLAMFPNFCIGIHKYSALTMTSLRVNLILHVCETRKLVRAILHWKQRSLCDNWFYASR